MLYRFVHYSIYTCRQQFSRSFHSGFDHDIHSLFLILFHLFCYNCSQCQGVYLGLEGIGTAGQDYGYLGTGQDAGTRVEQVRRDLERLVRMGVNVIRLEGTGTGAEGVNCSEVRTFYSLCRKRGFLTGDLWIRPENLPVYRGLPGETTCQALLAADGRTLTERYYYYQAKWSSEPVLYPVLSTLHRQENGLLSLTIYSNQKKVVLYVDGLLFLFQTATSGDPEFIFEDIPVAKLPLHLAAEAGNLSISLTVTKL